MWRERLTGVLHRAAWKVRQHPYVVVGLVMGALALVSGLGVWGELPALSYVANLLSVAVIAGSFVQVGRSGRELRIFPGPPIAWNRLTSELSDDARLCLGEPGEAAHICGEVNRALPGARVPLEVLDERFRLDPQARAISTAALREQRTTGSSTLLTNERKIRLRTPVTPTLLGREGTAQVQRTDYFSSVATNELTGKVVTRQGSQLQLYDGRSFWLEGDRLIPFARSRCSNHLGVSAMALTVDGCVILTQQGESSAQSRGRFAPAASGSMDWRDLSRTDADLLELARVATRRELREECALDEDEILATQLLGFALLLHRGGKPEFLAVCSLGTTADRISLRRRERGLIERHEAAPVDLTGPHAFADSLAAISATHPGRFAVQWGLCVEAVRDHLDDGTIDRFLAEHRQRLL